MCIGLCYHYYSDKEEVHRGCGPSLFDLATPLVIVIVERSQETNDGDRASRALPRVMHMQVGCRQSNCVYFLGFEICYGRMAVLGFYLM